MEYINAPVRGRAIPITEVGDPVFAEEILGKGLAIEPAEGVIFAPADGIIATVADTRHCVGMVLSSGVELLIHVGIDTVRLRGKHYMVKVKPGQPVKKGDVLVKFNLKKITSAGYDTVVPVIICNPEKAGEITFHYGDVTTNSIVIIAAQ